MKTTPREVIASTAISNSDLIGGGGPALAFADAILSALDAAGVAFVPKEATREIENAVREEVFGDCNFRDLWRKALAASPFTD